MCSAGQCSILNYFFSCFLNFELLPVVAVDILHLLHIQNMSIFSAAYTISLFREEKGESCFGIIVQCSSGNASFIAQIQEIHPHAYKCTNTHINTILHVALTLQSHSFRYYSKNCWGSAIYIILCTFWSFCWRCHLCSNFFCFLLFN